MVEIRFTQDCSVTDESGTTVFEAGKSYKMKEDSARHWISRSKAVEVTKQGSMETAAMGVPERAMRKPGKPKNVKP